MSKPLDLGADAAEIRREKLVENVVCEPKEDDDHETAEIDGENREHWHRPEVS